MTSFSFFKYFDAFELDVNVVNFVYYGKTRKFSQNFLSKVRFKTIYESVRSECFPCRL